MRKDEHLKSVEKFTAKPAPQAREDSSLSLPQIERVAALRLHMLASLASVLSPRLREALTIKLDYEKESLLTMVEEDAQILEVEKKRSKLLNYTYFKKKPLNINTL